MSGGSFVGFALALTASWDGSSSSDEDDPPNLERFFAALILALFLSDQTVRSKAGETRAPESASGHRHAVLARLVTPVRVRRDGLRTTYLIDGGLARAVSFIWLGLVICEEPI